ncbi:C_GCAxxG_C_C family protein [Desulfobulbus marinus]|nr:C_GCAxxG_C_C family protein [Desulfogranum marinum]
MGQEKLGIADPNVIKAFGAFGGGVAGSGNVCGAMLAGVAVISSLYSRGSLEEKENPRMWKLSHQFMARFTELTLEYGGVECKHIARINWNDRNQARDFYKNPESRRKECIKLVGETASLLGELLEQETARN